MYVIRTELNGLIQKIERWNRNNNLGLLYHGTRNERACWSIGNRLLCLNVEDNGLTFLQWIDYKWENIDTEAKYTINFLKSLIEDAIERNSIIVVKQHRWPPGISDRISEKTLERAPRIVENDGIEELLDIPEEERTPELIKGLQDRNQELWESERSRREKLSSEDAAEEFLGPRRTDEEPIRSQDSITQIDTTLQSSEYMIERPKEPPRPPESKESGGCLNDWFDWYHKMHQAGFKATLKEIAKEGHWSYGWVKQSHQRYKLDKE